MSANQLPDGKFKEFALSLARFNRTAGCEFLGHYMRLHMDRPAAGEDRPWDVTPESLHYLSRFFLRWSTEEGSDKLTEQTARELLRQLHPLQDTVNQRLVRSLDPDDQLELALRQEFLRAFWGTRGEWHLRPLDAILQSLGKDLSQLHEDFSELSRLPWMIAATCKQEASSFNRDELDFVCNKPRFDWLKKNFSMNFDQYNKHFDAGFHDEYFETAHHPLTVRPFITQGEDQLIPAGFPFFYHQLREWTLDVIQEKLAGQFGPLFNNAVLSVALRMVKEHVKGAAIEPPARNEADLIRRNRLIFRDAGGQAILIQIVPQRLSDFHLPTCNVRNIYDRIAALITPTIHGLGEDMRSNRTDFRRTMPLVVTWTPLYVRHVGYLQKSISRMLVEHYELEERFHPRYELLDLAELEVVLAHLTAFRDITGLLDTKRQKRFQQSTFTDFLRDYLGNRFRGDVPPLQHVVDQRRQAQVIVRNRLKRKV